MSNTTERKPGPQHHQIVYCTPNLEERLVLHMSTVMSSRLNVLRPDLASLNSRGKRGNHKEKADVKPCLSKHPTDATAFWQKFASIRWSQCYTFIQLAEFAPSFACARALTAKSAPILFPHQFFVFSSSQRDVESFAEDSTAMRMYKMPREDISS